MSIYADASFLVSLYTRDSHSLRAQKLLTHTTPPLTTTDLGQLEITNALCQRVYRKDLSKDAVDEALGYFHQTISEGVLLVRPVTSAAFSMAFALARKHTPSMSTSALDILHVACAMSLGIDAFYTFDRKQSNLAAAVGLKVP